MYILQYNLEYSNAVEYLFKMPTSPNAMQMLSNIQKGLTLKYKANRYAPETSNESFVAGLLLSQFLSIENDLQKILGIVLYNLEVLSQGLWPNKDFQRPKQSFLLLGIRIRWEWAS